MSPADKSFPLCSENKSSDDKKRQMEKKKLHSDEISPSGTTVPIEPPALSVSEMLHQFWLVNAHFDQFGDTIKKYLSLMIYEKASPSTQELDTRLYQKMDTSTRLLEDELGTKLTETFKYNEAKVSSKISNLDSKIPMQLKSNDTNIASRLAKMDTALANKIISTDNKVLSKINASLYWHKKSINLHVAKILSDVDTTASDKFHSYKIVSSVLDSINPKIDKIIKSNFDLQSPVFL